MPMPIIIQKLKHCNEKLHPNSTHTGCPTKILCLEVYNSLYQCCKIRPNIEYRIYSDFENASNTE